MQPGNFHQPPSQLPVNGNGGYQGHNDSVNSTPRSVTSSSASSASSAASRNSLDTDRLPAEYKSTVDQLLDHFHRVSESAPSSKSKRVYDTRARLSALIEDLQSGVVTPAAAALLGQLVASLNASDYSAALATHRELSRNFMSEVTRWGPGVKELINLSKS